MEVLAIKRSDAARDPGAARCACSDEHARDLPSRFMSYLTSLQRLQFHTSVHLYIYVVSKKLIVKDNYIDSVGEFMYLGSVIAKDDGALEDVIKKTP